MERTKLLELYEVQYSDFMLLSSDYIKVSSSLGEPELERLSLIRNNIMKTLGPMDLGLLAINGVPNISSLYRLLKIVRKLVFLDHDQRKHLLKKGGRLKLLGSAKNFPTEYRLLWRRLKEVTYQTLTRKNTWSLLI